MKLLIDLQAAQTESRFRGIGRQARALVSGLIAIGGAHDIHVLLNGGLGDGLDELRHELWKTLPRQNVHVFAVNGPVREMEQANLWRMRAAELQREVFIANLEPDLVYVTSLFEGVVDDAVTSVGLLNAPYPTAVTLFDLIPLADPAAYLAAPFMQHFYYRRAQSLKRADRLIAISSFARQEAIELLQVPGDRIDVALLGHDPSFRRCDLADREAADLRAKYALPEAYVFYVGAIEPRKNIAMIIEAFGRLTPEQRGDVVLVFGGRLSNAERARLMSAAIRFGVDPARLVLPGFIAEQDLAPLYSLARLFVFPSLQEGFGLPPLEAMACGTPVLVARNSSLPEVVGREDQMFGTFDVDDLAAKMARVLNDKAYADDLRSWGIERARSFTWDHAAQVTLASLETLHEQHRAGRAREAVFGPKPRLAFVSPLPSDRTGVAVYASELLRELGCHFDIECVIDDTNVTDSWIIANFVIRDVGFFRRHADSYDFILYQMGNSEFHSYILDLLAEFPGVVILHDFFISGLLDWLGNVDKRPRSEFLEQLYLTHGLPSLKFAADRGRHEAAERYPSNQLVFNNSHGVVVHSRWSIDRAREIFGDDVGGRMAQVPHLRALASPISKPAARSRLGLPADALVVATFGFVAETKLGDILADAWARSEAGRRKTSMLIFVGDYPPGPWGEAFERQVADLADRVLLTITGYVDREHYDLYLAASDFAVQLRQQTRGETSGAVLDCMAAGLPLVVNAHGPASELGPDTVLLLPDEVTVEQLAHAIDALAMDEGRRAALAETAREAIRVSHAPSVVGAAIATLVRHLSANTKSARQETLIDAIGELYAPVSPGERDIAALSQSLATSYGWGGPARLFFDITLLSDSDAHTGIERVVRGFLQQMIGSQPGNYRVEAVRCQGGELVYARRALAQRFGIAADVLPDTPIEYRAGDVYLTLEWGAYALPEIEQYLHRFRLLGGRVVIGIHDLLPLQLPHRFPPHIPDATQRWFQTVLSVADDLMCVSLSVAQDVLAFGKALVKSRSDAIRVNYFHSSPDIADSVPTAGLPDGADELLLRLQEGLTFLMVGTVEPRKGHQQTVDAFHRLWARGVDANLVIVGRRGWQVDQVLRSIHRSRDFGKRLFWIGNASDEYLERLYGSASALIGASEGEGFGLPIIEAAARGLPLLLRDLAVFREVASVGATYFAGTSADEMADAVEQWIKGFQAGELPSSCAVPTMRWAQSVEMFFDRLHGDASFGLIGG